jgi:hypothetical protein
VIGSSRINDASVEERVSKSADRHRWSRVEVYVGEMDRIRKDA